MRHKSDSGQALVLTAVALVALLGALGLAIDMGVLRYDKRLQQTAADAAAIAGATNLYNTSDTTSTGAGGPGVVDGAIAAAAANGFSDTGTYCNSQTTTCPSSSSVGYVTVTVNNPPANGPHAGNDHYVEVLVSDIQPTYFSKILGVGSATVVARAVASAPPGYNLGNGCLITTQPPTASIEGVNINGNPTLNASTCGISDNGNFNTKGNALIVNAATFGVAGNWVSKGTQPSDITCGPTQPTCPVYPTAGYSDPLAGSFNSSTAPAPGSTPQTCTISGSGDTNSGSSLCTYDSTDSTYYIQPGTYCSITIKGVASDKVVFDSGTYIIEGTDAGCTTQSLNIPGNATISSAPGGVFFYFMGSSTINVTGTPTIDLTAESSGTYAGLLMWEATTDTNVGPLPNGPVLSGNDGSNYDGILYFPNDQLTFAGNATSSGQNTFSVGVVISGSIGLSGDPTVNLLGSADVPTGVDVSAAPTLVE